MKSRFVVKHLLSGEKFFSPFTKIEWGEEQIEQAKKEFLREIKESLEMLNDDRLNYLDLQTEEGVILFPASVLKDCIFSIEEVEDDKNE